MIMHLTIETKNKLIEFRQKGFSVPELSKMFGVARSTASRYARLVEILPEYKERWLQRRNASKIISERDLLCAKNKAEQFIPTLENKDLVLIISSLYWAEGAKKDFSFTNSSPEMVKLFVSLLSQVFFLKKEDLKVSIRIYEDLDKEECILFWADLINIEPSSIGVTILQGKKIGKLKHGMCRVRVKKAGLLLKTIFAINKRVQDLVISS
jgi:hypothetical protein